MENVAILGAMPQEIAAYRSRLRIPVGIDLFVEATGVGKVAAAAAVQRIICSYKPDAIIFTGVAGGLDEKLKVGDVGVGVAAIDADLDVRAWDPTYTRGEQPFTHNRVYTSHQDLVRVLAKNQGLFLAYIATGSSFLDATGKKKFNAQVRPDLSACLEGSAEYQLPNLYEMEGSAILQVANQNGVPAVAIRAVSDTLNGDAAADFNAFIENAVDNYVELINQLLSELRPGGSK